MNKSNLIVYVLLCFIVQGCGFFSFKSKPAVKAISDTANFRVVNKKGVKAGGKILLIPFRAGSGVEANEELDRISLMIVKGLSEVLIENESPFEVIFSEDAKEADLMIVGHITGIGQSSGLGKWIGQKETISLAIKGKLIERGTNKPYIYFEDSREEDRALVDHKQLGHIIGQKIGDFLLNQSQK